MGSHIQSEHIEYFNDLKQQVLQYDLMVDKLIIKVRIMIKIDCLQTARAP